MTLGATRLRRLSHLISVLIRHGAIRLLAAPARRWRALGRLVPAARLEGPERLRRMLAPSPDDRPSAEAVVDELTPLEIAAYVDELSAPPDAA